ncbi:MAG: radical SAM protein [Pirellulaceae bacterium]
MPHVCYIPLTGLRVRHEALLELGMAMPGLAQRGSALAELPALALLTLAGMTPNYWTSSYHDAARWDETLVEAIVEHRPTLVAISALTASIDEAYRLSAALRARGLTTVIGGLHATARPEEAGEHFDAVVVGEGEPVWRGLLSDAECGNLQSRYQAASAFDLAQAPLPRWELLGDRRRPRMTLQSQRGCPFACDFCGASRLLGRFREKPLDRIAEELDALSRIAPQPWLELADDNTFAGTRDFEPLLQLLTDAGARYFTETDWRIGERPEIVSQLANSGCVQVLVGIESLVFRYGGMGAKQAEFDRMMQAAVALQEAGVVVNGCFIIGAEGETEASLDRLTQFLLDCPLAEIQLTLQTPFPGTSLYARLRREGRLLADRDWSHYTLFDVTYQPDLLSVADLEAGFQRVVGAVFSPEASARRAAIRRRVWRNNSRLNSALSPS